MEVIRRGARGEAVRDVQRRLLTAGLRVTPEELEGSFGASTESAVREFQQRRGLPADGLVGADTWSQLVEAGYRLGDRTLYLRSPAFRGDDVRELQRMLNALGFDAGKQDGLFGRRTAQGLMEFQRNVAAKVDGIVGLDTVRAIERMRPAPEGVSRAVVREEETARHMSATLAGSVVAIDVAEGAADADGAVEASRDAAFALAEELRRRGALPLPLHGDGDPTPGVSERAKRANANEAVACISVAMTQGARVATCAYYGTPTTHSPMGLRLAESIHAALTGATSAGVVPGGGVHAMSIAILRETRMPAVQVETGEVRPELTARAIVDGIEAYLGAGPG